jgi:hypothetical protein
MLSNIAPSKAIIFGLALICWVLGIGYYLDLLLVQRNKFAPLLLVLAVPSGAVVVLMILNACVFPIAYSVFGDRARTPFPKDVDPMEVPASWIRLRAFSSTRPTVTWLIFPTGLGIEIFAIGRVFLPFSSIVSFEPAGQGAFCIWHACPELRSPVFIPSDVFKLAISKWR